MSKKVEQIKECSVCKVPEFLHGTCCGWVNAGVIIFPRNSQEESWKMLWLDARSNNQPTTNPKR